MGLKVFRVPVLSGSTNIWEIALWDPTEEEDLRRVS